MRLTHVDGNDEFDVRLFVQTVRHCSSRRLADDPSNLHSLKAAATNGDSCAWSTCKLSRSPRSISLVLVELCWHRNHQLTNARFVLLFCVLPQVLNDYCANFLWTDFPKRSNLLRVLSLARLRT